MNDTLRSLLLVQDRDAKMQALHEEYKSLPVEKQRLENLQEKRKSDLTKAKVKLREIQVVVQELEHEVEKRRVSIERLKEQQFDKRNATNFKDMTQDIKKYEDEVDERELFILEKMEEGDKWGAYIKKAEGLIQKYAESLVGDIDKLKVRAESLKKEYTETKAERDQFAREVSEEDYAKYTRLKQGHGLPVVVEMSALGECGGCHIHVVKATEAAVLTCNGLVCCESCGRILYC